MSFGIPVRNGLGLGLLASTSLATGNSGGGSAPFTPAALFASGEQGVWYDPSDFSTLFQDSAGTTPVTAVEQPVGRMLDLSGRGNHATQATSAARPTLSARVNLIRNSETPWTQTSSGFGGLTLTATGATGPLGNAPVYKSVLASTGTNSFCYSGSAFSSIANVTHTFSQIVKSDEYEYVVIKGNLNSGIGTRYGVLFNTTTGAFVNSYSANSPQNTSYASVSLGGGWWKVSVSFSITGAATYIEWGCLPSPNASPSLDANIDITTRGNGTSGILLAGSEIRVANDTALPAYQRVNTATDYDATGFPYYLFFDGIDDSMATASINFTATAQMSVFSGLRQTSAASTTPQIIVELSAIVNNNAGSFLLDLQDGATAEDAFYSRGSGTAVGARWLSAPTVPTSAIYTCQANIGAPSVSMRVNGTQVASSSTSQGTGNYGNYPLYIGLRFSGGPFRFTGRLYSLIVRGAATSETQIGQTERWISNEMGGGYVP
jgi:hypothetical protein